MKYISKLINNYIGKKVRIYIAMGDPPFYYDGVLKLQDDFGILMNVNGKDVFISGSAILLIESTL